MQRPVLYNTHSQHTEQSLSHEIKQNVDRNRLKCKTVIVRNLWKGFMECVNGKLHNAQYHLFVHSPWVFNQIIINLLKTGKSRIFNVSSTHKIWCHCIDSWCQLGCHRIGLYNLFICCVVGIQIAVPCWISLASHSLCDSFCLRMCWSCYSQY